MSIVNPVDDACVRIFQKKLSLWQVTILEFIQTVRLCQLHDACSAQLSTHLRMESILLHDVRIKSFVTTHTHVAVVPFPHGAERRLTSSHASFPNIFPVLNHAESTQHNSTTTIMASVLR